MRHHAKSWLVLVPLVGTLALVFGLGHQAIQADRSHRAVAEGVLRDYAGLAASEAARLARRDLEQAIRHTLEPHTPAPAARDRLPAPEPGGTLPRRAGPHNDCGCVAIAPVDGFFRYDRSTGAVRITEGALVPDAGALLKAGLPETLDRAGFAIVVAEDQLFGVTLQRGSANDLVGFQAPSDVLKAVFDRLLKNERLLPESLTAEADIATLLALEVLDDNGQALFASAAPRSSAFVSERPLPGPMAGLRVRLSLHDAAADRLIIGGLPRTRLPMLLGLLALSIVLTTVASWQLWRERELARLRETFVSSVSHELRTPLAQIRLFVETLRLGRVRSDDERQRALDIIDEEAARLGHLVENALCFTRGDRPRTAGARASLPPVVAATAEAFLPMARERRCQIDIFPIESCSVSLSADALRQVLLNLLDNAAKYGPAGQTIVVSVVRDGDEVRLQVDDEGPGVPPEERSRIWEPFYRLDRQAERRAPGTGIGLSVVRALIGPAGGRVTVESSPRGGARFVVRLPSADLATPAREAPESAARLPV